jgi:glucose/mannose transport system substrate-binding protein
MANLRLPTGLVLVSLLPLTLVACACAADNSHASSSNETIELFSWWTAQGEAQALQASLDIHKEKYPNVTVTNLAVTNSQTAHTQLEQKIRNANPPDTFQANAGADLLRWVKFNGIDTTESKLEPINTVVSTEGFYKRLVDNTSLGGDFYGVPMNIHRINSLFYSKQVFRDLKILEPTILEPTDDMTLEQFNQLCVDIKNANAKMIPLALGTSPDWMRQLVFEDILPAVAGAKYYEEFWHGQQKVSDPQIAQTIQEALFLRCGPTKAAPCDGGYINNPIIIPIIPPITWQDALKLIQSGNAAMGATGDWAKGYFESNGWKADLDFGVVQFPGAPPSPGANARKVFIYTADSFPWPIKSGSSHALAAQLLQTFASVDSQLAFNQIKGSLPARSDIIPTEHLAFFDAMRLRTYNAFQSAELGLAMSGLLPNDALVDLNTTLSDSITSGLSEPILTYLTNNYSTLTQL